MLQARQGGKVRGIELRDEQKRRKMPRTQSFLLQQRAKSKQRLAVIHRLSFDRVIQA